ncbi:MAG: helix-turn-helix domain-containing protein [Burkholderiaceae bacterium]|nr:helix-turn-helix domain-containing protein [Burkholderiaceae bacterium]
MDLKNYFIDAGVKKAGFARAIDVSPALLHQWIEKIRPVAIQHCAAIEQQTGGRVTRQELRPDDWQKIWPELAAPANRRATDPASSPGHCGRQPASPHNILDTVPDGALVVQTGYQVASGLSKG